MSRQASRFTIEVSRQHAECPVQSGTPSRARALLRRDVPVSRYTGDGTLSRDVYRDRKADCPVVAKSDGTAPPALRAGAIPPGKANVAAWGNVIDRILLSLRDDGPATRAQLERRLGLDQKSAGQCMTRLVQIMARPVAVKGRRRAHICGWSRGEHEGCRDYPRPIYAFGHGANAPKPARQTSKAVKARYWQRRKERLAGVAP